MLSRLFGRARSQSDSTEDFGAEWGSGSSAASSFILPRTALTSGSLPIAAPPGPPKVKQHKMIKQFGKKGSSKGCFNMPTGIAVTSIGDIVVVDSENSRLQVFSSEGSLKSRIGEKGCLPHQLNHPMTVTLSKDGEENFIVTDSVNAAVKVFMSNGTFMTQFGGCGMFDFPYGVAVTSNHYLVVTDVCQHSVMVLYPSGSLRNKFGQYGDNPYNLDHPYSVTVDSQDQILVSDSGNTCIKRFDIDGHLLQCFTLKDFRLFNEHFVLLAGITIDAEDNVIIVGNATVYISAPNGRMWEIVLPVEGLHSPKAVAYSPLGQVAVTQCGLDNRHEVCLFSYNPQDYRSLQGVPRVLINNLTTNGLDSEVRPLHFEHVDPCGQSKRHVSNDDNQRYTDNSLTCTRINVEDNRNGME